MISSRMKPGGAMKGVVKIGGSIIFVFCTSLLFRAVYQTTQGKKTTQPVTITMIQDSMLSELAYKEIDICTQQALKEVTSPYKIVTMVSSQCPYLKKGAYRQISAQRAATSWSAFRPALLLNNDELILESGKIVKKNYFTQHAIEGLCTFNCPKKATEDLKLNQERCKQLLTLEHDIYQKYKLFYENAEAIRFIDSKNQTEIKSSEERLLDTATANACTQIAQIIKRTPAHRQKWIIADIRFKDQIIISRGGGSHEGGTIF